MGDYSDNQWVTCFQESAEAMLGIKADELGSLKDSVRKFSYVYDYVLTCVMNSEFQLSKNSL